MRRYLFILLLSIVLPAAAFAAEVQGVRLWRAPDNTRLVFDLDGPVEHRVFVLKNPERVVIDLEGSSLRGNLRGILDSKSPIRDVRTGMQAGALRIVLDMAAVVQPKSFSLTPNQQYGHRLVVDLFDDDPIAAFAAPSQGASSTVPVPPPKKVAPKGRRDIIIAIDAGHGGEDPGAIGPRGLQEKGVVLAIARQLQQQINAQQGFRAELIRTGDYFIPLRRRTEIARQKNADLFVSIHADAAPRTSAYGASVYALSDRGATSETARWLADSENRSDLIGGAGNVTLGDKDQMLAGVLLDLSMTASLSSSLDVGQRVLNQMGDVTRLHKNRVEQAGFMVLKSPDIPSILVETGFITNPSESRKLNNRSHQAAIARSIAEGIKQFFYNSPPPGTLIAAQRNAGRKNLAAQKHVVKSGDSISMLAQRYQVSVAELRRANQLKGDRIRIGQTLIIPARTIAAQP